MKRITTATIVAAALAAVGVALAGDEPPTRETADHAAFLQQLVGEWSVVTEAIVDPEQDPFRFEGEEHARMLGGQWLIGEYTSEVQGQTINSILTLGYDPAKERFVATYVDSMQTHLWSYTGTLDDAGTTLTLKTEGPFMGDPNETTDFRVVIESKDADRWVMRSLILVPDDDEWFEFLHFEYRRKEQNIGTPGEAR